MIESAFDREPSIWVPRLRIAAIASAWIGLTAFLSINGAGPVTWDELLYLSHSVHPEPAPHILNRFAHVYAQKLFVTISGDAITGARLYWAVLVASTTALIFLSSRRLAGTASAGLIAVLLFFAVPVLHRVGGITYADVSVMFLGSLAVWLVLGEPRPGRLVCLGLALFLAAKSKESAVCFLPVLLVIAGRGVAWPHRFTRLAWFLFGGALGMLLLIRLDAIFLGDALFQVRPENLRACLTFNQGREFERSPENWMSLFGSGPLLFPFVCYALALWTSGEAESPHPGRRAIAAIPLVLIAFLTFTMIRGPWGVVTRYLVPALPALAIIGAQLFHGRFEAGRGKNAAVAGGLGLAAGFAMDRFGGPAFAEAGWNQALFRDGILFPLSFLAFLAWLYPRPIWRAGTTFVAGAASVFLLLLPAYGNLSAMADGNLARFSRSRFRPLELLSADTDSLKGARVYMSARIFEQHKVLARHERAARWMLQIHFNEAVDPNQVIYGESLAEVLTGKPDYAFVSQAEWAQLQRTGRIEALYEAVTTKKRRHAQVTLLRRRPRNDG